MAERVRFGRTKEFLIKNGPALTLVFALSGCAGGSVSEASSSEKVVVGVCDPANPNPQVQTVSYHERDGGPFTFLVRDKNIPIGGNPVSVNVAEHRVSVGDEEPKDTASATHGKVLFDIQAQTEQIQVASRCAS